MGLYKRTGKTGTTWCIQYFAHGKRIREAVGPSKREAELVLGKRKAAIREGKFFDVTKESTVAFGMLCDRYLREHAAVYKKARSFLRNEASTKVLVSFFGENTLAKNIQPADVQKFVATRKEQHKSNATINADLAHLSHLFTWAIKMKLVSQHPVKGTPRLKANQKDRFLSQEEIQQLLAVCAGDLRDMVVLALGTGMRASEVLRLDRAHTDLSSGVATLPDTKNSKRRYVPLPAAVIESLRNRPVPLREWFPGWKLQAIVNAMQTVRKRAQLAGVSFHTLRHTFASHAVMAGVDLYTLAKILGHKDIKMVQRYAHLAPDHLKAAVHMTAKSIFAADVPRQVPHGTQHSA